MTDPHICSHCAAQGATCCSLSAGSEEFCFPVSEGERDMLLAAGYPDTSCVREPNSQAFIEQLGMLLPEFNIAARFPVTGTHWRLSTTPQGNCVFLRPDGCSLDRDTRPIYCRLFPLWEFHGQLTWFTAEECLANRELPSLADMLQAMSMTADDTHSLFASMCRLLELEKKCGS